MYSMCSSLRMQGCNTGCNVHLMCKCACSVSFVSVCIQENLCSSFLSQTQTNEQLNLETCLSSPAVVSQLPGGGGASQQKYSSGGSTAYRLNSSVKTERQRLMCLCN